MFDWLKRKVRCSGSVHFRGNLSPKAEEFDYLAKYGIEVQPAPPTDNSKWQLQLSHEQWGQAQLHGGLNVPAPPAEVVRCDPSLTREERDLILQAGCSVTLAMEGRRNHVLRDRKHFLRFLHAVAGDDGLAAVDHASSRIWSNAAMQEELSHDADVDVEALFTLHAVQGELEPGEDQRQVRWLHTHGLDAISLFDFDIINPSSMLIGPDTDCLRALAFAIAEGRLQHDTPRFHLAQPNGYIRMVDAGTFQKRASEQFSQWRDHDEFHSTNRSVVCEPKGFFSASIKPSKLLLAGDLDGMMLHFSSAATQLMAERAQATYSQFRRLFAEFEELGFMAIAKLGYSVDHPRDGNEREYMWFKVERLHAETIDATLLSRPFDVSRLQEGDRGEHRLDTLTDWTITTPMGMINPRNNIVARVARTHREKLKEIMQQVHQQQETSAV